MGYYTDFKLSILGCDDNDDSVKAVKEFATLNGEEYILDGMADEYNAKWYECKEEMLEFSKNFPELVFKMEGCGENKLDFWVHYYKGGKVQVEVGTITYPEYDEGKLTCGSK